MVAHASFEVRNSQRFPLAIPCQFSHANGRYSGRLRNLGLDGAFVETSQPPANNGVIELEFETRNGWKLKMGARVVHTSLLTEEERAVDGFGIYFISFQQSSLTLLRALVNRLAADNRPRLERKAANWLKRLLNAWALRRKSRA